MKRVTGWTGCSVLLVSLLGCKARIVELSPQEQQLAASTGIPEGLAQQIRNVGDPLERLTGLDANEDPMPLPGVYSSVSSHTANAVLEEFQRTAPKGYYIFLSGLDIKRGTLGFPGFSRRLTVVRGMGPYDVMRAMGTNGANYQISTEMVIAKLREWDDRYGLDIYSIDGDSVTFGMRRQPGNVMKFAREVYEFCPDAVNQGSETLEKLAADIARTHTVALWWD